jgi:hypothetical protein
MNRYNKRESKQTCDTMHQFMTVSVVDLSSVVDLPNKQINTNKHDVLHTAAATAAVPSKRRRHRNPAEEDIERKHRRRRPSNVNTESSMFRSSQCILTAHPNVLFTSHLTHRVELQESQPGTVVNQGFDDGVTSGNYEVLKYSRLLPLIGHSRNRDHDVNTAHRSVTWPPAGKLHRFRPIAVPSLPSHAIDTQIEEIDDNNESRKPHRGPMSSLIEADDSDAVSDSLTLPRIKEVLKSEGVQPMSISEQIDKLKNETNR